MARTISDEQMRLSIVINGDEAQKELSDLEKSTRLLKEENKSLLQQKRNLERQGQRDTQQYRDLSASIRANTTEINTNRTRMQALQEQIGITGLTMAQLQSKANLLRTALRNSVPGSEDYVRYQAELTQVNNRLGELSGRSRTAQSSIGSLADSFNRYQGIAVATIAALTGVVLSIQKIIDINGKLSDAQSDVMKTTGMTKVEVDELTKSFGLLQTRTSRIDLLGIAEQGGRIGIAKAEIGDFVAVMNKASVALGDSFTGGAEEVANKLGKIKFLFEQTKGMNVDQSYNAIGSAINDLGANGVASEANIADFTTRIGSLTDVLKPTIQETLALGTAFEESGIEAEVSSRAYGIFMKQASTETAKFAQVMGISEQKVKDMINSNPLEFMLQFSQGMKGMNATDTAKTLDALGISADGANKVIGAMGNNTARFRELMELSNNSFASGTSLINEYELKNNNLAATLEKISKTVSGWFSSETFIKWLGAAVNVLADFIGASNDADGSAQRLRDRFIFMIKVIAIVVTSYLSYNAAVQLTALWTNGLATATRILNAIQNRGAVVSGILRNAQLLLAAAYYTITGNTVRATAAMRLFNASASANPLGLILVAISAVVTGFILFNKELSKAERIQKSLSDVQVEATKNITNEKAELDLLTRIAKDETIAKEKRLLAIKKVNDLIPDYIGKLTLENIRTAEGVEILKKYTAELYAVSRAKAVQSKFDELAKAKVDAESKTAGDFRKEQKLGFLGNKQFDNFKTRADFEKYVLRTFAEQIGTRKDETTGLTVVNKSKFQEIVNKFISASGMEDKIAAIDLIDSQMKALESDLVKSTVNNLGKDTANVGDSKYNPLDKAGAVTASGTKKDPNSSQAEINRRTIDEAQKTKNELLSLEQQLQDDTLYLKEDGVVKEILLERDRYIREVQALENKKVHAVELAKLDEDIAKAKESGDKAEQNRLEILRKGWDAKNQIYDDKINEIIRSKVDIHNKKIGVIIEKAGKDLIEKENETYQLAKLKRETDFLNSIAYLEANEEKKQMLRDDFNKEELKKDEEYLIKKLDELNRIIAGEVIGGIDFSLMTPEAKEKFKKDTIELQNAIAKLSPETDKKKPKELGLGNTTDILGFSAADWYKTFDNLDTVQGKMKAMQMAVQAMQQLYSQYDQIMSATENASLKRSEASANKKKEHLKKRLDSGVMSQKQYDKQVSKIDKELDAKKADLEYKQAKRQKALSVMNIIMSTAQAIIGIWAQFPKADFGITAGIMSGVVGTLGALQLATVLSTPLPAKGYEAGLYQDYVTREQDGKRFKSSYQGKTRSGLVSKTSHFLVAENGPEMVIDAKAWRQMNPEVKDSLIRELRGVKGFEQGLYNQAVQRYEVPASSAPTPSGGDAQMMNQMMMSIMAENLAVLKEIKQSGIIAIVTNKDMPSMKNLKEGIEDYNNLRTKSKK
jgi:tubulin-specific chaperone A